MFRKLTFLTCLIFLLVFCVNYAFGVNDKQWFGSTSTAWMTASNWQGGTIPNGTNDTWIVKRAIEPTISTGTAAVEKLLIGPGWAGDKKPTLTMTAGTLNVDNYISIGYGGSGTKGTFVLNGGTVNADRGGSKMVLVGHGSYGDGLLWMTGGTINTSLLDIPANWNTGTKGDARVMGGTIYADTLRMKSGGYLNFEAAGQIILNGNDTATVQSYINSGYIKAYHGMANVTNTYNSSTGKTTVKSAKKTQIGAIFWGGWYSPNPWDDNLEPSQYHYRLPFYTTWSGGDPVVTGDNQTDVDDQIDYASDADVDYFAHLYYHCGATPIDYCMNYGLKYHLSSSHQNDINFCLILTGAHLGDGEDWSDTVDYIVDLIDDEDNYQKVDGGRPLFYMRCVPDFRAMFNWDNDDTEAALEELRTDCNAAGMGYPYIACMVNYGQAATGRWYVDNLGFDAISSYAPCNPNGYGSSYSTLASQCTTFWNDCKSENREVIPACMAGWDPRPRDAGNKWFQQPTMSELKDHVADAIEWCLDYPTTAKANTVLIYALNEYDEGGWLDPNENEDTERLDAVYDAIHGL